MRRPARDGLKLPSKLLNELGIEDGSASEPRRNWQRPAARKERRKAARVEKKTNVKKPRPQIRRHTQNRSQETDWSESSEDLDERSTAPAVSPNIRLEQAPKSILKKSKTLETTEAATATSESAPRVPKRVRDQLAEDDATIAALEKALGIKGKKKTNQTGEVDGGGLDDLLEGIDELVGGGGSKSGKKEMDKEMQWLREKRKKALKGAPLQSESEMSSDDGMSDDQLSGSDDEASFDLSGDDERGSSSEKSDDEGFDGFEAEEREGDREVTSKPTKERENPYLAPPVSAKDVSGMKYVPPSLRKPNTSDSEALVQLRRQVQGLLNRLSEANIISILGDIEKLYQNNARQNVTATIIDLLMGLLSDPAILQDTFIILHAGFITGIYKVIGTDFGAQCIEKIVAVFDEIYTSSVVGDENGKKLTNLISLVAEMYNFQAISSRLVYDLIRHCLEDLNELNAELLLRIVRISGLQLRQDDPSSLKDTVLLLQQAVAKIGQENLSVRTKFMIETINSLKNNRVKTGLAASALLSEHTIRMKKALGSLNTRSLKASEPLRIGLTDIRDPEKRGKWWLVGASYRDKDNIEDSNLPSATAKQNQASSVDDGSQDLLHLAKLHRMNTDIRRSIFVTIMSATDYRYAHLQLLKLRLKKAQELEIPHVLIHCAGAESMYNPYYTLIAKLLCGDRKLKMAFQFSLWDLFKRIGKGSTEEDDDDQDEEAIGLRSIVNWAKMFGTLVADGTMSIGILKTLEFMYLPSKTQTFVELFLVTVILSSQQTTSKHREDVPLQHIFAPAKDLPGLVQGLLYFLRKVMRKSEVTITKQDKATVKWGCKVIEGLLTADTGETTEV